MTAYTYVPRFATTLQATPRVEANAMEALALAGPGSSETEWAPRAAAALVLGASWEGEDWDAADVAHMTGVPQPALVRQLAALSRELGERIE